MSTKHTPGPWRVSRNGTSVITENVEPSGGFVADCDSLKAHRGERDAANARLIAAAPELLQMVIDLIEAGGDGDSEIENDARALIAKATGGAA